ncbi:MAG: ABC transporter permease subunit [Bacilli bacterium]|nr:ABC transporter permease subunit [Bacilli bacterium]
MIRLIGAEFKKVFSKKAIYIMLIIALGFGILTNLIYKYADKLDFIYDNRYQSKEERDDLIKYSKTLNLKKPEELDEYIYNQTEIYFYDFCIDNEEWRCNILTSDYYELVYNYMNSLYNPKADLNKEETKAALDKAVKELKENDVFGIYKIKKAALQKELDSSIVTSDATVGKKDKEFLEARIIDQTNEILKYDLLLEHKISADRKDTNRYSQVESYIMAKTNNETMDLSDKLSKEQKQEYRNNKEIISLNKYLIDHDLDDSQPTVAANLKYFFGDFSFFIVLFVIIISGGIMADEYHKGTIKQLLIKPYTRSQILSSKLLTVLLLIPIFALMVFAIYFILTCLFTGFKGIFDAIPVYDYVKDQVVIYNVFNYNLMMFVARVPYFVIVSLISLAVSTITGSTALSIVMPLALVFFSNIINMAITNFQFKWLRWFVTYIWNLENYIFVRNYDGVLNSLRFNIIFIIIYILVIAILPYIFFNRKDIKNV